MKISIPILTILVVSAMVVLSCKRDYTVAAATSGTGSNAFLKIVHASPNFNKIFPYPDSINVYLGATKINSSYLKYGTTYPVAGIPTYAAVSPGTQSIRITLNGATTPDSLTVISLQKTLVAGKYYTLVITDSIKSPRDSSQIWLQDSYPQPTAGPGYFYLRFMHAVMDGMGDTVDLYSPRRNQVLFNKIKMDSTTPFASIPTMLNTQDTLYVRKTGTGTILAKVLTLSFGDQQFYTAYYIGDTAAAPAAKTRSLGITQNR